MKRFKVKGLNDRALIPTVKVEIAASAQIVKAPVLDSTRKAIL